MGTPVIPHLLLRNQPLTDREWFELLDDRVHLIAPVVDRFTLTRLSEVKCLITEGHGWAIGQPPEVTSSDPRWSINTQGIFGVGPHRFNREKFTYQPRYADGEVQVWGLTRDLDWILVKVEFKGTLGYKDRGAEEAQRVSIKPSNPIDLCRDVPDLTPPRILEKLGETCFDFLTKQTRNYERAMELVYQIGVENSALRSLLAR